MVDDTRTAVPPPAPAWKTCLDIENQDAEHYLDYYSEPLLEMLRGEPRRVLELGCASGRFGFELKSRHPGAMVVGIEAGRGAAAKAATRLDRVICARIEEVDFAAEGFHEDRFDLLVAADILEHLVNPWRVLERLRPCLAADGRMLASIPNVRNLDLMRDLVDGGRWQYVERGLLDVTHVRFFTLIEIDRMLKETGFRIEDVTFNINPALAEFYQQHQSKPKIDLKLGRLLVRDLSQREFTELCAQQFFLRVRPA